MANTEMTALLENRRAIYKLLSRLYILEVDAQLLASMKALSFPGETGEGDLDEGYALLRDALASLSDADLEDLAVDYARVFLSAGVAEGQAAFPYESVYTSRSRLMVQDSCVQVVAAYAGKGLAFRTDAYHVPEDHLGIELDFMAHLCDEALSAKDDAALQASLDEQAAFVKNHLLNWAPLFCGDVNKYASTAFYKGVGKLTRGFLNLERKLLCE